MSNSQRNPKELKELIEQANKKTDVVEESKKVDGTMKLRSKTEVDFYSPNNKKIRSKTEIDLLNSQLEEQNRLIQYYKVWLRP